MSLPGQDMDILLDEDDLLALLLKEEGFVEGATNQIKPRQDKSRAPLSYAQQRLWVLEQLEPGSLTYTIPRLIRLRGQLNVAAVQSSLNYLFQRHEIFRTCFVLENDTPVQKILPDVNKPRHPSF